MDILSAPYRIAVSRYAADTVFSIMYAECGMFGAFGSSDQGLNPRLDMIQVCTQRRDFGGEQNRRWGGGGLVAEKTLLDSRGGKRLGVINIQAKSTERRRHGRRMGNQRCKAPSEVANQAHETRGSKHPRTHSNYNFHGDFCVWLNVSG